MMASMYGIIYLGSVSPEVGSMKDPTKRDHRHPDGMSSGCLYAVFEIEYIQQKKGGAEGGSCLGSGLAVEPKQEARPSIGSQ
jgi:hypothetical protein